MVACHQKHSQPLSSYETHEGSGLLVASRAKVRSRTLQDSCQRHCIPLHSEAEEDFQ